MRVLIIEDEYLIATTLAQMLTDGGHIVTGMVGSADKAIQMLDERQCDVAVVDAIWPARARRQSGQRFASVEYHSS
jgi:DNA-binding response OmpR family regulator